MTVTYSPGGSSNRDKVRLLIFDTDVGEGNAIFQDEEINQFLSLQDSNVFLASAMALEVMATREAMLHKVISLMDLSMNGPAVAVELRKTAKVYRDEADIDAVDTAVLVNTVYQERERYWKQVQRGVI